MVVVPVIGPQDAEFQPFYHRYIVLKFQLCLVLYVSVTLITGYRFSHQRIRIREIRWDAGYEIRTRDHGRNRPVCNDDRLEQPEIGYLRTVVVIDLSCEGGDGLEIFTQIHRQVRPEIVFAVFLDVTDEDTVIRQHTQAGIIRDIIVPTRHRQVMLLLSGEIAKCVAHPVIILIQRIIPRRPLIKLRLRIQRCQFRIPLCFIPNLPVGICIHHFRHTGGLLVSIVTGIGETGLAFLSFLGRDDDHPVIGIHTINCSGRILQHGNRFDIFRVQPLKVRHVVTGNPINDQQRSPESTDTHQ